MTDHIAYYPLAPNGAVGHWLACGTVTSPIKDILSQVIPPHGTPFGHGRRWIINYWAFDPESAEVKSSVYKSLPPSTWKPSQRPTVHAEAMGGRRWNYAVAPEDGVIDFSLFNFEPQLMQAWLFALVDSTEATTVDAELITIGPARLWLNGALVTHFSGHFSYVAVQHVPVRLALRRGLNELYVHGEMLGWREARLALGLRLVASPGLRVGVPLGDVPAERWQRAEHSLNHIQFGQFAVPRLPAVLSLNQEASTSLDCEIELNTPQDPFWTGVSEVQPVIERCRITVAPGGQAELPLTKSILERVAHTPGEHTLNVTIRPGDGTPLTLQRELWASAMPFSQQPYGSYDLRRQEALEHLAAMPHDVLAAMAAVTIGRSTRLSSEAIDIARHFLDNRYDCADFYAIGLLAALYRFADSRALDEADQRRIEQSLLNFKFWIDEPGIDAMCYFTENHQILFHVAEYLTGQRYPNRLFTNGGLTGEQHKKRARGRIESWIVRRLRGNFSEWDSNTYMTLDAFAMLALVEFADSPRLRDMATTMLHKLFFLIACQSFRGAQGCTHGRCYVSGLKSARAENTSSLQRIAWGMGIFNGETRAAGLLAMARRYRVPDILQQIGADTDRPLVTLARSTGVFRPHFDMKRGTWDVRTITRRTPHVMLAAAVDYQPGTMGIQEHLWQATLGPEALVFTTYPGNSQEHGNARPNFWAGSARLPRVGMVDRTVICLYRLEPGVGLGFTHVYFPAAMFDEHRIEGQWAFARVGAGYVALWGDGDLVLTPGGVHAGQELRSQGAGQVWLCHIGDGSNYESLGDFVHRVRANDPQSDGLNVQWQAPEGKTIRFGWQGPLTVDGTAEDWEAMPHYANAYTNTPLDAERMIIRHGSQRLALNLRRGGVDSDI